MGATSYYRICYRWQTQQEMFIIESTNSKVTVANNNPFLFQSTMVSVVVRVLSETKTETEADAPLIHEHES
jgi:hypothetical protein